MTRNAERPDRIQVTVRMPPDTYARFKALCDSEFRTMSAELLRLAHARLAELPDEQEIAA